MDAKLLSELSSLTGKQKVALKKRNINTVADLILASPRDVANKIKLPPSEMQAMFDNVCKELAPPSRSLEECNEDGKDRFTTGDATLDEALGGGICTGMLWELVGESASGKTQLALQLSLFVQISPALGGLSGAACYLTTNAKLATKRLNQIMSEHTMLSSSVCSLSDIHTRPVPTLPILMHTLTTILPELIRDLPARPGRKPLRLLVLDSIAALFHSSEKPSSQTLIERSKVLSEISALLHAIASKHRIAVLVINEVTDVFERSSNEDGGATAGNVVYHKQVRWFNRAQSVYGEDKKEAGLGLVWANQVNVRVMLSRTGRRLHADDAPSSKRRRIEQDHMYGGDDENYTVQPIGKQPTLLRRLTVIFSSVYKPISVDFIVAPGGISVLADSVSEHSASLPGEPSFTPGRSGHSSDHERDAQPSHHDTNEDLNVTTPIAISSDSVESSEPVPSSSLISPAADHEYDDPYQEAYDEIPEELLLDIDFDALDHTHVEDAS